MTKLRALAAGILLSVAGLMSAFAADTAYSPTNRLKYQSPNYNRPNMDSIKLWGNSSTGDISSMSAVTQGGLTLRSFLSRFRDLPNLRDFGAVCDGSSHPLSATYATLAAAQVDYPLATALTDEIDSAALQKALAIGIKIWLPSGTCLSNREAVMTSGSFLQGAGMGVSTITGTTADRRILRTIAYAQKGGGADFTLDRVGTAVSGGDGWRVDNSVSNLRISFVESKNSYNGFSLSSTDFGILDSLAAHHNRNHGIAGENGNDPFFQWNFTGHTYSQINVGDGYNFTVTPGSTAQQVTMFKWTNISAYGNLGRGIRVVGSPAVPVNDLIIVNPFVGEDGQEGAYLDTYGINNKIDGGVFELSGAAPGTGAVNVAACIYASLNNQELTITGTLFSSCGSNSILSNAPNTRITGGSSKNPGQAGSLNPTNNANYVLNGIDSLLVGARGGGGTYGAIFTSAGGQLLGSELGGSSVNPVILQPDTIVIGNLPQTIQNRLYNLQVNVLSIPSIPTDCTGFPPRTLRLDGTTLSICP